MSVPRLLWSLLVAAAGLPLVGLTQEITLQGNRFVVDGRPIWLNGINAAWIDWNDFGGGRFREFQTDPLNRATRGWDEEIASYAAAGINCARVWIDCDGTHVLRYDGAGNVTGTVAGFIADVGRLLDIGQKYGVYIMPVLTSFDHARQKSWENTWQQWRALLGDNAKIDSYIANVVVPLVQAYPDHPYLFAWEICNEPEWMYAGSAEQRGTTRDRVVMFHARVAAAINRHTAKPVTTGTAGWQWMSDRPGYHGQLYSDASLQAALPDPDARLDFFQIHYYGWMQSQGASPFDPGHTPAHFLGAAPDRPVIVGECPGLRTPSGGAPLGVVEAYQAGWDNDYQGVMGWSSSGHDGAGTLPEIAAATARMARKFAELIALHRPVFTRQPASATVAAGTAVSFAAEATAFAPVTYRWFRDEQELPGAVGPVLDLTGVQTADAGAYRVFARVADGAWAGSRPVELRVAPPVSGKLRNLSVRAHSGTGADVLTAGFVTRGGAAAHLLIRGVAQKLASDYGVPGTMADPRLVLIDPDQRVLGGNDDWAAEHAPLMLTLGAFDLDAGSGDAVFAGMLPADMPVTVQVLGAGGGTGTAIAEVYDAHAALTGNRLVNLSSRLRVDAANPLVAGFVLDGNRPHRVLIRAAGPALRDYEVPDVLPDPDIAVHRIDEPPVLIASNLDWADEGAGAALAMAADEAGAFPFAAGSLDAGLLLTLHPGVYTVTVQSATGEPGIALAEIYDLGER